MSDSQIDNTASDWGVAERHQWLGEPGRSHYIPSWYRKHTNLDLPIRHDGQDLGFTLRQVLPFRRWAIDADGGVRTQHEFNDLYMRYLEGMKHPETMSIQYEHVPEVRDFVSKRFDGNGQLVDIHYTDDGTVLKPAKFTQEGGVAPEYLQKTADNSEVIGKLALLTELMTAGAITPSEFAKRAAALNGGVTPDLLNPKKDRDPEVYKIRLANMEKARAKREANRAAKAAADAKAEKAAQEAALEASGLDDVPA